MRYLCVLSIVMIGLLTTTSAHGQATATLRGRVRDAQAAPVAAATVTVTSADTGFTRAVPTSGDGSFLLANLPPATLDLTIAAQGFATATRRGLLLEVGQTLVVDVDLAVAAVRETLVVSAATAAVDTSRSVVDAVIPSTAIEVLPLNGRNFLELALLVPGNTPAPNFDPTKSNSVVISSAGQLGRGGNITIDGADNNDDVVGGPLQNVTQESVQEFQIATQRFTAESGRSASSVINVVTRSGTDQLRGSFSFFARDSAWQGLPATYDRSSGDSFPFDRQQLAGAVGGPLVSGKAFWFAAAEYRNQDGAVLVGERDVAARAIRRSFAAAPLDDTLGSGRVDWRRNSADALSLRYAGERAEDTGASSLDRAIGSASYRQRSRNSYQSVVGTWTRVVSPTLINAATASFSTFDNAIVPIAPGPQHTFPSMLDGSSFRVPQGTTQKRFQLADTLTLSRGAHSLRLGGEWQRVNAAFDLGVFQDGRLEFIEDFPSYDSNGDGRVDDGDLLFAVTLRSGKPDQALVIPDADNDYVSFFVQDDWRLRPDLTLNVGLRYEMDTDVKNVSRVDEINPIVQPFLQGTRGRDLDNWGPRIGFNWAPGDGRTSVHGGYGIYYDRITLQIQSLERGLDGRALPIEVRAGNVFYLDSMTGQFPPFAPSTANPFTGFILPGAGASGINIIDNTMQNPSVQQFNLGFQRELPWNTVLRVDGVHDLGTHFIIGRPIGAVYNPVVGGPDQVVNLESSVNTHYDALLVSAERRSTSFGFRAAYTFAKAFNYANDDQIPFGSGPIDPDNLRLEYGPTPNDQRHRFTLAAWMDAPAGLRVAPIMTFASGVPMDILMPDGLTRVPAFQRNAGGRIFETGADLNRALVDLNASGGINGQPLPYVRDDVRFGDGFSSFDLRISRPFTFAGHVRIEPIVEVFNLFNVTNILGVSVKNYSGYANVLVRDSADPADPGFMQSSSFGEAVSTAGGVFGSGGPRAFQFAVRATF
ncbi:Outer membrane cobalamin receptor protein [Luteitalea pratensis]|uniref:Outer membrane cobalamin receptor protein n=1 Tax=Luteitalea pratensis TaxID=1855912 RepID=A0A143PM91_LUTPR|nr:carboxypeptidase regulatory-like domain-containing protein [Luteitalea pratensis]AMY08889.1 Outer membrane cobalamin receptor protein [Luteitalea pratensis]